ASSGFLYICCRSGRGFNRHVAHHAAGVFQTRITSWEASNLKNIGHHVLIFVVHQGTWVICRHGAHHLLEQIEQRLTTPGSEHILVEVGVMTRGTTLFE